MRNIIYTSLAIALTGMATAQQGPTPGCYAREYSKAHLDKYPDQVARAVWLWIQDQDFTGTPERHAWLLVDFANQGHVKRDGHGAQRLDQGLVCFETGEGHKGCAVDCDGGSFVVTRETDSALTIATEGLWVGDTEECGGAINIAEFPGTQVKYRLNRVDEVQCMAQVEN
ncbi:hypothetical protein [Roseovarius pelagicus]|uniref:Uncharacterized protein n=1 Tax=Roseovarius pelagicus TaxID=2980108 RepID=A0ABY6D9S4_9RHOB|nr:hypothetical protein [Roseovarius pelagicus]UXX82892.1 hypothetical protein N7U68_17670 [Roseovarius pelagicus]